MRAAVLSLVLLGPAAARSPIDDVVGPLLQEASALRASVDPKMKSALAIKLTSIIIPSSLSSEPGLLGLENNEAIALMTKHDDSWRAAHQAANPKTRFGHLLCGSQANAELARSEIRALTGEAAVSVAWASSDLDAACWRTALTLSEAESLAGSKVFLAVGPVPSAAKFAPDLLVDSGRGAQLSDAAMRAGLAVVTHTTGEAARTGLVDRWRAAGHGLLSADGDGVFFPGSAAVSAAAGVGPGSEAWQRASAASGCSARLALVLDGAGGKSRVPIAGHLRYRLVFSELGGADERAANRVCALRAAAFFAAEPEVIVVEAAPEKSPMSLLRGRQLGGGETESKDTQPEAPSPKMPFSSASESVEAARVALGGAAAAASKVDAAAESRPRPKPRRANSVAVTGLQSGDSLDPTPLWDVGLTGSGQFVQVTDTGFDDASCFLRDTGSKASLTGAFSSSNQVARSTASSPVTDTTKRKVVQYISADMSDSSFGYDYAGGHGTHVAGTIAGKNDDGAGDPVTVVSEDYYSDCGDYTAYCASVFCPTCSDPGTCDVTCGFTYIPSDYVGTDYSGMCPDCKLMAWDLGDNDGALAVPSDYYNDLFSPAADQGASISSNSWGGGNTYTSDESEVDRFILEQDMLIVFAAGNDAYEDDDDWTSNGDGSVLAPGVAKNTLTVGAAENIFDPDTVADFSSRGPTLDMRIKPDVAAPGDPMYSTHASGQPGLASCEVLSMSGTSMATPAVSGVAALVRQFLTSGQHATYSSTGATASDYSTAAPSSALLKAMLIGSTTPLSYGYDSSGSLVTLASFYSGTTATADSTAYYLGTPGVDFHQGFGHVRTSNVLPLGGDFELFLFEKSLSAYEQWSYPMTVTATSTDVVVTLVWHDPPGPSGCGASVQCLVHDLDLSVSYDGTRYFPNFGAASTGTYAGQRDTVNNVEKITIPAAHLTNGRSLTVAVKTNGLSYAATQAFAVVVTGGVVNVGSGGVTEVSFTIAVVLGSLGGVIFLALAAFFLYRHMKAKRLALGSDDDGARTEVQMTTHVAPKETVSVTVPPGVSGGQKLSVQTPSGKQLLITLPRNAKPGMTIQVQV